MTHEPIGISGRYLRALFDEGVNAGLTDGQLLERFVQRRDETAEAALEMAGFAGRGIEDWPEPIASMGERVVWSPFMDEQRLAGVGHDWINVLRRRRSPAKHAQPYWAQRP